MLILILVIIVLIILFTVYEKRIISNIRKKEIYLVGNISSFEDAKKIAKNIFYARLATIK